MDKELSNFVLICVGLGYVAGCYIIKYGWKEFVRNMIGRPE